MFEVGVLPHPEELGLLDDAELIDVLAVATSMERLAQAYRLHLIDRLFGGRTKRPTRPPRAAPTMRRRRKRKARRRRHRR
jgi:hypothetical protein